MVQNLMDNLILVKHFVLWSLLHEDLNFNLRLHFNFNILFFLFLAGFCCLNFLSTNEIKRECLVLINDHGTHKKLRIDFVLLMVPVPNFVDVFFFGPVVLKIRVLWIFGKFSKPVVHHEISLKFFLIKLEHSFHFWGLDVESCNLS